MNKIDNPFLIYGYEGPEYFCDRQQETRDVIDALKNGCNLTLKSPRRYGKTGLIRNAFHYLQEENPDVRCFYVDIFATRSLSDFVQTLGRAVVGKLDTPLQKAEGFVSKFFRSCQITMQPNMATGLPEFGLSLVPQNVKNTLKEIFDYLAQADTQCYIAIDEFQQVLEYEEEEVEALLRTYVQNTHNAHFIFSGSKLHIMAEMFDSPRHPFYRSTEKLNLGILDEHVYYEFAKGKMQQKGIILTPEVFHSIYAMVDGVTWYVQTVLNRLYRLDAGEITSEMCQQAICRILLSEQEDYQRLYHLLTANQAKLLRAVAVEGIVAEPLSGLFLRSHRLKSASSVQRSLEYLMKEEYLYRTDRGYIVYDRFLGLWLKQL